MEFSFGLTHDAYSFNKHWFHALQTSVKLDRLNHNLHSFFEVLELDKRQVKYQTLLDFLLSIDGFIFSSAEKNSGILINQEAKAYIYFEKHLNTWGINLCGDKGLITHISEQLKNIFPLIEKHTLVEWFYKDAHKDTTSSFIRLKQLGPTLPCFYPWITLPLSQYYEEFNHSPASVMVLLGSPGTGKTNFIRHYLQHCQFSCAVTYSNELMGDQDFYREFLASDTDCLVVEDADTLLMPRTEQNQVMHTFLGISDGLISLGHKKIIFTTNLESVNKIDAALLRPGRCFDVQKFRKLNPDEAVKVIEALDLPAKSIDQPVSLAELFQLANQTTNTTHSTFTRLGFR